MFGPDAETDTNAVTLPPVPDDREICEAEEREHYGSVIEHMLCGTRVPTYFVANVTTFTVYNEIENTAECTAHVHPGYILTVNSDGRTSVCSMVSVHDDPALVTTQPIMRMTDTSIEIPMYGHMDTACTPVAFRADNTPCRIRWDIVGIVATPVIRRCIRMAANALEVCMAHTYSLTESLCLECTYRPPRDLLVRVTRRLPTYYTDTSMVLRFDVPVHEAFFSFWDDRRTMHLRGIADNTARVDTHITNDPRAYRAMMGETSGKLQLPVQDYPAALDTAADRAGRPWLYEK